MELEKQYTRGGTSPVALDNTLGVIFVGIMVSASLFGILTTQCYYYALRFKQDPGWLKCVVAALWIIDAIHQIAASALIFQYTVHHYGNFEYLPRSSWLVSVCIMLQPLPAFTVQMYFTRRLYLVNPKLWPLAALTAILSLVAFAVGEACAALTYTLPFLAEAKKYTGLVTLGLVTCAVCDIAVTVPVAWALYSSRTGFKQTNILLVRVTLWTVYTGALPASFALLDAITFIAQNRSLIHLSANIVLTKLYSNTLLVFLNRRGTLTKAGAFHLADNIAPPHMSLPGKHTRVSSSETGPRPLPSLKKHEDGLHQIWVSTPTHHMHIRASPISPGPL